MAVDLYGNQFPGSDDSGTSPPVAVPPPVTQPPPPDPTQDGGILSHPWHSIVGGLKAFDKALGFDTNIAQPPPPGEPTSPARGLGLGTRDVIQGSASPFTGALDVATWPFRAAQRAMGIPTTAPSDLVSGGLTSVGLPTASTPGEKERSSIIQGASAVLPSIVTGAIPAIASRAPALTIAPAESLPAAAVPLAQGGAGAYVGDKAQRFVPDWAPSWVKPVVGLLGNVVGAGTMGGLANKVEQGVNAVANRVNETAQAYNRLGIPYLGADVSESPFLQKTAAFASKNPVGSIFMGPAERKTISGFGNAVEETAGQLGDANTNEYLGKMLQDEGHEWRDQTFPALQDAAWKPVDAAMSGKPVTPDSYRSTLETQVSPPNALPNVDKAYVSPAIQKALDTLNMDVPPGENMTWAQAQNLRSRIGKSMGTPGFVQDVGPAALSEQYGGIAEDMRRTAEAAGAGEAYQNANAVSTAGHTFMGRSLSDLVKANNPAQETVSEEQAARAALTNPQLQRDLRTYIPGAADQVGAYKIRDMATATPGSATVGSDVSPNTFLTEINKMQQTSPGGYNALFTSPETRQRLDDLQKVASTLRETSQNVNRSNTGPYMSSGAALSGLGAAYAAYQAAGLKGALTTLGLQYGAAPAAGVAMSSPTLARYLAARRGTSPSGLLTGGLGSLPQEQQ